MTSFARLIATNAADVIAALIGWEQTALPAAPTPTGSGVYRYISPSGATSGDGTSSGSPITLDRWFDVWSAGDVGLLATGTHESPGSRITAPTFADRAWLAWDPDNAFCTGAQPVIEAKNSNSRLLCFSGGGGLGFYNFDMDGRMPNGTDSATWGLGFGRLFDGDAASTVDDVLVQGVSVHHTRQTLFVCGDLTNATFTRVTGYSNGQFYTGNSQEGFYFNVGSQAQAGDSSPGNSRYITIDGLEIYDVGAEAVDIKVPARDITIRNAWLHDCEVKSQGALTVLINDGAMSDTANILLEDIFIARTTRAAGEFEGYGICIGRGGVTLNRAVCWDNADAAVGVNRNITDAAGNTTITIDQLIAWNNGLETASAAGQNVSIEEGLSATNSGSTDMTVNATNVIGPDAGSSDHVALSSDFVGPLTTDAEQSGQGPASGYQLASGSSIPASAGPLGKAA